MESALDVLSRAATMVQNNASETRLTSKELPTAAWRRERRQRTAEYQVHDAGGGCGGAGSITTAGIGGLGIAAERDMDSPIDMSVTSSSLKHQRSSPPPPYREPLPGTNYAAMRPSVITQAPPKREPQEQRDYDNRSTESVAMCDIDEHFRRSLGPDYAALFAKKSPTPSSPTPSPQPSGSGTPMQSVSPNAAAQLHVPTYQQHLQQHGAPSPLPQPLPLLGTPKSAPMAIMHSPTLKSASVSPQPELPPPQDEPLSLHRSHAATPPSPSPSLAAATVATVALAPATPPPPLIADVPLALGKRALDSPHHTPPRYNTPPPAYGSVSVTSTPNPAPTMPAIIRVKAEPGLAAASSTHTPPASPTSSTNISIFTKPEASVDDHFAKALGDTWKKLQGQKE
ncbi:extensin isoform X2 [Scaptodrosophila lebanonensis]|uniref:Extensin isoform X2 n=1 Tax=Drosophila lebanonensis TaxID=7225 RepID=A0A6J2T8W4_DROLE|nr:extensin isoform X2 [Scaptodrosophila lebanonensis]